MKLTTEQIRAKIAASAAVAKVQAASSQVLRLSTAIGNFVKALILSDGATAVDAKVISLAKVLADTASAVETVARTLGKPLSDRASPTEAASIAFYKAASDIASISDAYTRVITKILADTVSPRDDVDITTADDEQNITFNKSLSEVLVITDVLNKTVSYLRSFNDSVTKSDQVAKVITKAFAEIVTAVDVFDIGSGYVAAYEDAPLAIDVAIRSFNKILSDVAGIADTSIIGFGKTRSDLVSQTDAAIKTANKGLTENAVLSDSGSLFNQNYVSEDYFAERYVGFEQTF